MRCRLSRLSRLWGTTAASARITSSVICRMRRAVVAAARVRAAPRTYRLFVPPGYDGRRGCRWCSTCTAVVATQQDGRNSGRNTERTEGFIVATLEAEGGRWNVPVQQNRPDDVMYVSDVIAHVAAPCVHGRHARVCDRVLRWWTHDVALACQLDRASPPSRRYPDSDSPARARGRAIPVLTFHGLADPQNPYDGHAAAAARSGRKACRTRWPAGRATTRAQAT